MPTNVVDTIGAAPPSPARSPRGSPLGAWRLDFEPNSEWVIDVLNAWVDGVDAELAGHCCLGTGFGNTFRSVEDALPRVLERWMAVNVEQFALDFTLRDMQDVKALEVVPPRP
jgi:hypothetical protein